MFRSLFAILAIFLLFTSCLELDNDVVKELVGSGEPEWVFVTRADGLAEDTVTTMLKDSQGYFWFGHLSKGITRWDGADEFIKISVNQGLTNNYVWRIVEAPDGKIWVATNKGYDIIDGSTIVTSEYYNYTFTDIVFPEEGTVWLSSQLGIYVFSDVGDSLIVDVACQQCRSSLKLLVDSQNNIWASSGGDIRRYNAQAGYGVDKRYFLYPRDGAFSVLVTEIYEDAGNNIYGGSLYGEFNTFLLTESNPEFFNFGPASISAVRTITTYNNQLWIGTQGSGIIRTNGLSVSQLFNELPSAVVLDLLNDGRSIWIASFAGVAKYTAQ